MKTKILFGCFVILFGFQITLQAESYQRWIVWVNEPKHVMTRSELVDICTALDGNSIVANKDYKLSTGIIFRIPNPGLYKEYIEKCVKAADKHAKTFKDVISLIELGEETKWGNDISVKVKNYYYSTVFKTVKYNDNYSGAEFGIPVLLINGIPVMKMECGNPLEVIVVEVVATPTPAPVSPPAPAPVCNGGKKDTTVVMVVVQVQNQGTAQQDNWQRTGVTFIPDRNEDYSQPDYWYNRGGSYNSQGCGMVSYSQPIYQPTPCFRPQQSCYRPRAERQPRSNPPRRVTNGGHDAGGGRVTNGGHDAGGGRATNGGH